MNRTALRAAVLVLLSCIPLLFGCAQRAADTASEAPPVEEGYVEAADGVRLFYRKVGDGPQPVFLPADLFLHPAFDRLAEGRTLYYYDMRNRGLSDSVTAEQANSIQQDVEDLETLRAHFGLERTDLVGFSYLGLMVMMYAKAHPEHVRRVVQLGPVAMRFGTEYPEGLRSGDYYAAMDSTALAELRKVQAEGLPFTDPGEYCRRERAVTSLALVGDPANVSRLSDDVCDKPNEWPAHLAGHFGRHFASVQALELAPADFAGLGGVPVLTIHGTLDRNAAYGGGREWALTLPDARLVTVEGAAHCAWADDPGRVFGAIEAFLGGAWPEEAERVSALVRAAQ